MHRSYLSSIKYGNPSFNGIRFVEIPKCDIHGVVCARSSPPSDFVVVDRRRRRSTSLSIDAATDANAAIAIAPPPPRLMRRMRRMR